MNKKRRMYSSLYPCTLLLSSNKDETKKKLFVENFHFIFHHDFAIKKNENDENDKPTPSHPRTHDEDGTKQQNESMLLFGAIQRIFRFNNNKQKVYFWLLAKLLSRSVLR